MRKSDGGKDKLIFLGDYIDRGPDTPSVIEYLIDIKKRFGDQVVFIRGNHEEMLLSILGKSGIDNSMETRSNFSMWIENGGASTIRQYAKYVWNDNDLDSFDFPPSRVSDLIPKDHVKFIEETVFYYEVDHYIFVHAGCDPTLPLKNQDKNELIWNRTQFDYVKRVLMSGELPWEKTIVTGHNYTGPFINEKYMMLDCSFNEKLLVTELNSMEAFYAKRNKKRLVKISLNDSRYNKKPPASRRVNT